MRFHLFLQASGSFYPTSCLLVGWVLLLPAACLNFGARAEGTGVSQSHGDLPCCALVSAGAIPCSHPIWVQRIFLIPTSYIMRHHHTSSDIIPRDMAPSSSSPADIMLRVSRDLCHWGPGHPWVLIEGDHPALFWGHQTSLNKDPSAKGDYFYSFTLQRGGRGC